MHRVRPRLVVWLLFGLLVLPATVSARVLPAGVPNGAEQATVTGHIDGDKIKVSRKRMGEEMLFSGIDAPEPGECYAKEAADRVKQLLPTGAKVWLEKSGEDRDTKERLLRYVWLPGKDGKHATLLNSKLMREGYAGFDDQHDSPKYFERLDELEQEAKEKERGMWAACGKLHAPAPDPTPTPLLTGMPSDVDRAVVAQIIDGDTINVIPRHGDAFTVQMLLIDTPETRDPNGPIECYGAEASVFAQNTIPVGSPIYLERDVRDTDQDGRHLRYIWDERAGGTAVLYNEEVVRASYAVLATAPPDVKYVEQIRAAQDAAMAEGTGLWSACGGADTPVDPTLPLVGLAPTIGCEPAYPDFCMPILPDLDCVVIPAGYFMVLPPDPYHLDGDHDGIGCEG